MTTFKNGAKLQKVQLAMLDTDVQTKFTGYDTSLAQIASNVNSISGSSFSNKFASANFSGYDVLLIPNGTFQLTSKVTFSNLSNIKILLSPNALIQASGITDTMIEFDNCTNVIVEGGVIDAQNISASNFENSPLKFSGCTHVQVKGVTFRNCQNTAGVTFLNTNDIYVERVKCDTGIFNNGIVLDTCNQAVITRCYLIKGAIATDGNNTTIRGIKAIKSNNVQCVNNYIQDFDIGIEIWSGGGNTATSNNSATDNIIVSPWGISFDNQLQSIVSNNRITCPANVTFFEFGIEFASVNNGHIHHNVIIVPTSVTGGTGNNGIQMSKSGGTGSIPQYNSIDNNRIDGTKISINLAAGTDNKIHHNKCINAITEVMYFGSGDDNEVNNNKCENSPAGIVYNGGNRPQIKNNVFNSITANGAVIMQGSTSYAEITNNYFEACYTAVNATGSPNLRIKNNKSLHATNKAFYIATCDNVEIVGNTVRNSSKSGIYFNPTATASTCNLVKDNVCLDNNSGSFGGEADIYIGNVTTGTPVLAKNNLTRAGGLALNTGGTGTTTSVTNDTI
jgi:hypothetical protein